MKCEIIRICPKCGRKYTDEPAISRVDNKTEICPDCGMVEAMESYEQSQGRKFVPSDVAFHQMAGSASDEKFISSTICYISQFAEMDGQVPAMMKKTAKCLELASGWDEETLGVISCMFGYCKKHGLDIEDSFKIMAKNLVALADANFVHWSAKMKMEENHEKD